MSKANATEFKNYTVENIDYIVDELQHIIDGNYGEDLYNQWQYVKNSRMNKNAWLYQQYGYNMGYTQAEVNQAYNLMEKVDQDYFNKQIAKMIEESDNAD